jgi:hypothetical protein
VAGYSVLDRKMSEDTRKELDIYSLRYKIQQCINQLLSHTERMEQYCLPRQAWEYGLGGRR